MQVQSLFPENIPVETFDAPPLISKAERLAAMEAARKAEKNQECVKAFRAFLLKFNATYHKFIIADVIDLYKKNGLPLPGSDFRAVGSIVNQLTRQNILIWTGEKRELNDGTGRSMKIYKGGV